MHEMTRLIRKASPAFRVSLFYCPRTYIFITKQRKTVIKMSLWELLILAVGLSMDAFAVSVCKGLSVKKLKAKHMLTVGAYFGGFQALMPLLGYILGIQFQSMIQQFDHWIALLQVKIVPAISFIGATTFILSAIGIRIGNIFGAKYKSKAELVGGIVLILMGVKILLEHLGVPDMIFG